MILDFFIAPLNKSTSTKYDDDGDGDHDDDNDDGDHDKAAQNFFYPGLCLCLPCQSWVCTG